MKIIVSGQDKKVKITFQQNKIVESFVVAKADELLACVDKLLKKYNTLTINSLDNAELKFENVGLLTERTIRAIMLGLGFK